MLKWFRRKAAEVTADWYNTGNYRWEMVVTYPSGWTKWYKAWEYVDLNDPQARTMWRQDGEYNSQLLEPGRTP